MLKKHFMPTWAGFVPLILARLAAHILKKVPIVLHEQTGKQRAVAPFAAFKLEWLTEFYFENDRGNEFLNSKFYQRYGELERFQRIIRNYE